MAEPELGRKPLPIQRILSENVGSRAKSQAKTVMDVKTESCDKENGEEPDQEEETAESDWCPEAAAMSSTMAVSSLSTPRFFSMSNSNMSSINFSDPSFSEICQEKHFKTPNRKLEKFESEISPKEIETTPRTPRGWISDRTPSSGASYRTPSGSSKQGSSQRTPSSGGSRLMYSNYRTPGTNKLKTPSSGSSTSAGSGVKNLKTPSSGSSSTRWNPFDSANSADHMLNPTMSPNVFSIVISPSQEDESSSGRFWSIDQQAEMFPAEISDESPLKQSIHIKNHNSASENRTQEQIDLYFAEHHDITSPPDLPPTGPLVSQESPDSSYSLQPGARTVTTQTALSLPPILPAHVEVVLKQFYSQAESGQEEPASSSLSNSTLRRKLFNADFGSSEESSRSTSPDSEPEDVPDVAITPGKLLTTPLTSRKPDYSSAAWSSSPVRAGVRKTSFSPPDQMGSPMFSPIVKERISARNKDRTRELVEEDKLDTVDCDVDCEGELYQTAELGQHDESPANSMDIDLASTVSQSQGPTLPDNWTMSLPTEDDTEAGSKADTGYGTHTASITNLTPFSPSSSSSRQDSGVSSAVHQETCGQVQPHVLMSYHGGDNSNDISVGFPLGSSTPTKK